jgi:hypothetical protein
MTVFWRGELSDHPKTGPWQEFPRLALCLKAAEPNVNDLFDIGLSGLSGIAQGTDENVARQITEASLVKDMCPIIRFMDYKYSVDIDGNSSSWPGLFTKLLMKNAVIKVASREGFRQWYYDRLIPWQNFIPLSTAMTELYDVSIWLRENDDVAEQIAVRGQQVACSLTFDQVLIDIAPIIRDHITTAKLSPDIP